MKRFDKTKKSNKTNLQQARSKTTVCQEERVDDQHEAKAKTTGLGTVVFWSSSTVAFKRLGPTNE